MNEEHVEKLRLNSRIKHLILSDYVPTWASILGRWNDRINYFDCYAGPGQYLWEDEYVEGSPIIAIKKSIELLDSEKPNKPKEISLIFSEKDKNQKIKLQLEISKIKGIPQNLFIAIDDSDSETFVKEMLSDNLAPTFFFIDPYEHPFSLELMKEIMSVNKTEIMVNFMYYQIIRDIDNPKKEQRCLKLFAPDDPKNLDLKTGGKFDENKILKYLHQRLGAKYYIPFKVYFGPDEKVPSTKLKYVLIHYSNNHKAFDLMLNIMWKYSEDNKPLTVSDRMPILIPLMDTNDLETRILSKYHASDKISFNDVVEENWQWYFREAHFRSVLKEFEKNKIIQVKRITSKTMRGLSGDDIIIFKNKKP